MIRVHINDQIVTYDNADRYVVDASGALHIVSNTGRGNIATYANGAWDKATTNTTTR